jgi:hypothetical protein
MYGFTKGMTPATKLSVGTSHKTLEPEVVHIAVSFVETHPGISAGVGTVGALKFLGSVHVGGNRAADDGRFEYVAVSARGPSALGHVIVRTVGVPHLTIPMYGYEGTTLHRIS